MKKVVIVLLGALLFGGCGENPGLSVNGIKNDPAAYRKEKVVIDGIVTGWNPGDPRFFAIADLSEDGKNSHSKFVLPVLWEGTRPKVGEKVRVTAKLDDGKRYFVAKDVKTLK